MSEIRNINVADTWIYPSSVINAAMRATARELQNALGWMFEHETDSGGGVIGGFDVSEGAALRSDVERGLAVVYTAGNAAPLSKWSWVYSEETLEATHDAHEANPRIDLLTLAFESATDTEETLGRVGEVAASVDTQRGAQLTLVITKGTADPSPSAPATPAGHLLLYQVRVPATSGALVYYDKREFAPGPRNRSGQPLTFNQRANDGVFTLLELAARVEANGETAWVDYPLRWSKTLGLPFALSARNGAKNLYYQMAEDRAWSEMHALIGPVEVLYTTGSAADVLVDTDEVGDAIQIQRLSTTGTCAFSFRVPLRIQHRGLKITGCAVDYAYDEAFDGTLSIEVTLHQDRHDSVGGTRGKLDIDAAGTGSRTLAAMVDTGGGAFVEYTVDEDDRVWAEVAFSELGSPTSDAGRLRLFGIKLIFEDGNF
ncbi:MAG: hypothetical protein IT385_02700 [Deltaproteobacteria bacterium]|nr:hypothetical protein [Deltaproteobacteria bacterium]